MQRPLARARRLPSQHAASSLQSTVASGILQALTPHNLGSRQIADKESAMSFRRVLTPSLLLGLALGGFCLSGDAPETPIGPKWWPSEWGADDQRGAANRMTPARAREAAQLIKEGKLYSLGRVYEHGMPLPGKRHFSLTIPGSPT